MKTADQLFDRSISLLRSMIKTPSFSRQEHDTASLIESFLCEHGMECTRAGNNVEAVARYYDTARATLLLHSNTVIPCQQSCLTPARAHTGFHTGS